MSTKSKLAKSIRLALVFGAASTTILASNAAFAEEAADAESVERIQVTGSRIKRTDLESPVPVTIIGRIDIAEMGALNVADILNASPVSIAGTDQSNSAFTTSAVGLNTTQLRGIGSARTLILVNGRRFVSGMSPNDGYAVDLNSIPAAMIERIEILKSASSAIYGSDAIAGVVNIITRSGYDGVEVNVTGGTSSESDRNKQSFNVTSGNAWDTGSVVLAIGYDNDKGLKALDRDISSLDQAVTLDDAGNEVITELFSSFPPAGRVGGYNTDGTAFDGAQNASSDRFNRAAFRQLITPLERKYAAVTIHQEISDNVEYFAEFNYNNAKTNGSTTEPTPFRTNDVYQPARGGTGGISMSNPMVPQGLRDALLADGLTMDDNIPNVVRRMVELGARSTDVQRDTVRVVNGVDWQINDDWAFNSYLTWGKTSQTQENGGQVNTERAEQAFDVGFNDNGILECNSELARIQGCVPLNIFGAGTITQAAADYVIAPAKSVGVVEQFVVSASVTGELPLELSGGNVQVAFGYEHRLEQASFAAGAFAQVGATSSNSSRPTGGSFTSDDVYFEALLPLLDNLELDLAARYADHSITDDDTTWNVGLQYTPIEGLMLRASAASAIRTPNVGDLFQGRGQTFATLTDPCAGVTAAGGSIAQNNCLTIPAIAARVAEHGSFELTQSELQGIGGTVGGNPAVEPETSDSFSAGFVWQIMDGLSMTADYYDIAIEGAIRTTLRNDVISRCYDLAPGTFDPACAGAVLRDLNGALSEVHSGTSNENDLDTVGFDVELNYTTDFMGGAFGADFIYNHVNEWLQTSIEDGSVIDFAGEARFPDNTANLNLRYSINDMAFSWRMRYVGSTVDSVNESNFNFTTGDPLVAFNEFDAEVYHDLSATYFLTDNVTGTLTIRNALDTEPQAAPQGFNSSSPGINTVTEIFDVTGRYFQASVTMKF